MRASTVLNGPTKVGIWKPGIGESKWKPNAARLRVWLFQVKEESTLGSSAARAWIDRDSACLMASPASWTLVLPSGDTASSTARFRLSSRGARCGGASAAKSEYRGNKKQS